MFSVLGSALHRRRLAVLLLTLLVTALATVYGGTVSEKLSNGLSDYDDPGGGNVTAREIIERATGIDSQQGYLLLVRTDEPVDTATAPPKAVAAAAALLRSRPEVEQVVDYTSADGAALISRDGRSTVVVGAVGSLTDQESIQAEKELQKAIEGDATLRGRTWLGGATPGHVQVAEVSDTDLAQAELIAAPVILLVLFLVFRGLVAALIPLLGGIVSLLLTMAGLRVATEFMNVSTGAMSLAFALGLGLSIDFGLLIVSRYREELAERGPGAEAVLRTVTTAGRTVLFSALTVAAALAALTAFPQPYLRSMGLAGVITVLSAALFALLGLPPLLALLGRRINSLAPRRWQRTAGTARATEGRWYRVAQSVMRRPAVFALLATTVLLVIASPLLGVRFTGVDPTLLPEETSAGRVAAVLDKDYDARATSPLQIVLENDGTPDPVPAHRLHGADRRRPRHRGGGHPRRTGRQALGDRRRPHRQPPGRVGQGRRDRRPGPGHPVPRPVHRHDGRLPGPASEHRRQPAPGRRHPGRGHPAAALRLLRLGGAAAEGPGDEPAVHQRRVRFPGVGVPGRQPRLLPAIRAGGHHPRPGLRARVRPLHGLQRLPAEPHQGGPRTGPRQPRGGRPGPLPHRAIVTSAAILFCVPVGALALSRLVFIQELGLGAAFAVLIDATIVRAFLVPSLMALLGAANWWAPAPSAPCTAPSAWTGWNTPRPPPPPQPPTRPQPPSADTARPTDPVLQPPKGPTANGGALRHRAR